MASGMLYVVATPIGNLEDMTPRAVRILREVDWIAAEDTRHSRALLTRHDIRTPLTSYHEHNEQEESVRLVASLETGKNGALISDAGTPCISDPGYRLVRAAREADVPVVAVPGACAPIAALSVSGLPTDRFTFHGFFPRKRSAAVQLLESLHALGGTHIFLEAPGRVEASLTAVADVMPDAETVIAREITKRFEEVLRGSPQALLEQIRGKGLRGECVLLLYAPTGAAPGEEMDDEALQGLVAEAMASGELSYRDAVRRVAEETGVPRNRVYAAAKQDA